jgi:hypothetical protein
MTTKLMFIFFVLIAGFFIGLPLIKDVPEQQVILLLLWQVLSLLGMVIFGKFALDNYKKSLNM